jgi:heme exporter protein B
MATVRDLPITNKSLVVERSRAGFARLVFVVMAKDLRAELRTKEAINASAAFALVILLLFSFAFDLDPDTNRQIASGLLWLVFAFAGTLLLNRSFARELPNDCLDALIAAPVPASALFLGKALANYVLLFAIEMLSLVVFGIFYNVRWTVQFGELMLVLALGTWALTIMGTVFSALTVNIKLREVMLPILIYPFLVPALMSAIQLTLELMAGRPIGADKVSWLQMLLGFNVIYTAVSVVLIESVLVG